MSASPGIDPLLVLADSVLTRWIETFHVPRSAVEKTFDALPFPPFAAIRRLIDAGVPGPVVAALHGAGLLKVARVNAAGRKWEPDGPDPRLLIAVRDDSGAMIDAVAIASHAPGEWSALTGAAAMLGGDAMERASEERFMRGGARLRLYDDPWAWLLAGCEGICVLDWNAAAPALRMLGESVAIVADSGAGRGVLARLTHGGLPRVVEVQVDDSSLSLAERIGRRAA
ncbi:hypothetical protein [Alteriqipengyuania sp.]|uniref:hypothetical protein n=1 Tax=Alteriqipengyuania sp. TaxID=2800692 RepID=UPI0035125F2F